MSVESKLSALLAASVSSLASLIVFEMGLFGTVVAVFFLALGPIQLGLDWWAGKLEKDRYIQYIEDEPVSLSPEEVNSKLRDKLGGSTGVDWRRVASQIREQAGGDPTRFVWVRDSIVSAAPSSISPTRSYLAITSELGDLGVLEETANGMVLEASFANRILSL